MIMSQTKTSKMEAALLVDDFFTNQRNKEFQQEAIAKSLDRAFAEGMEHERTCARLERMNSFD